MYLNNIFNSGVGDCEDCPFGTEKLTADGSRCWPIKMSTSRYHNHGYLKFIIYTYMYY